MHPPPPILIDPPSIIRPLERGVWFDLDQQMQRLGLPREVRRSIQAEMKKVVGDKSSLVKATAAEMARYGGQPALGSMLINPFIFTPPAPPMVYSYEGAYLDNSNLTTYTFNTKSVGTAGTGRVIAVAVQTRTTSIGTPRALNSGTCNGNAMTVGPKVTGGSSGASSFGWLYIVASSGTTADFTITFSNGTQNCAIGVYRLFPVSSTPVDTATVVTASSASLLDLEVKTSGLALILVDTGRSATPQLDSYSWGGVDTPVHDLTDQINDQSSSLNLFSIPTSENDTTRDFTASATGDVVGIAGMSFQ